VGNQERHDMTVACFDKWKRLHAAIAGSVTLEARNGAIGGDYRVTTTATLAVVIKTEKLPMLTVDWDKSQFDHQVGENGKRVEVVKPSVLRASLEAHTALAGRSYTVEDVTDNYQVKCEPRLVKSIMGETEWLSSKLIRASLCPPTVKTFIARSSIMTASTLTNRQARKEATPAARVLFDNTKVSNKTLKPRKQYVAPKATGLLNWANAPIAKVEEAPMQHTYRQPCTMIAK